MIQSYGGCDYMLLNIKKKTKKQNTALVFTPKYKQKVTEQGCDFIFLQKCLNFNGSFLLHYYLFLFFISLTYTNMRNSAHTRVVLSHMLALI